MMALDTLFHNEFPRLAHFLDKLFQAEDYALEDIVKRLNRYQ